MHGYRHMSAKLKQPPVATARKTWTERQLAETLARHYDWNRAQLADLFKTLRRDHAAAR